MAGFLAVAHRQSRYSLGSGAERFLFADDTGLPFAFTTLVAVNSSDSGSGSEGTPSVRLAHVETGAGADAVSRIALANTEAASGADAATIAASNTSADAGSGAENTASIALTTTDTAAGVDDGVTLAVQLVVPNGDVLTTGWTDQLGGTANLWAALDETESDDSDYVTAVLA